MLKSINQPVKVNRSAKEKGSATEKGKCKAHQIVEGQEEGSQPNMCDTTAQGIWCK